MHITAVFIRITNNLHMYIFFFIFTHLHPLTLYFNLCRNGPKDKLSKDVIYKWIHKLNINCIFCLKSINFNVDI